MKRVLGIVIGLLFLVSCGEEDEEHLFLQVVPDQAEVYFGTDTPCAEAPEDGGLDEVTGYYTRVHSVRARWTSTTQRFYPQQLRFEIPIPKSVTHTCILGPDEVARLFGLNEEEPFFPAVTDENSNCVDGLCYEVSSDVGGQCSFSCGGFPLNEDSLNFLAASKIELIGQSVETGSSSSSISSAIAKLRVRFSK